MAEVKGFELGRERIDVVIEDETTGRRWELRHSFRPPADAEWLEYFRKSSAVTVRDGAVEAADPMHAELALWDLCIERVDDKYLLHGEPVMTLAEWKTKIPAHHKYLAARALLSVRHKVVHGPLA